MCGRYTIVKPQATIQSIFEVNSIKGNFVPQYNAYPSMMLPVITNESPSIIQFYRWGLIPHWAKSVNMGAKLTNARSETLSEKPSFKYSFQYQRCLVIADGYYEWAKRGGYKQKMPYRICLADESLFAFAGIWAKWKNKEHQIVHSFSIVTTTPQEPIKHLHHRMPVILDSSQKNLWLANDLSTNELQEVLQPYSGELKYYLVSTKLNSPTNNTPDLINPIIDPQTSLF